MDVNKDGSLSCDELTNYLLEHGLPVNERLAIKELFQELDIDGSGDISKHELWAIFRNRVRSPADILKHKIADIIDADGDGTLTSEELSTLFKAIDVTKSGSITCDS